GPSNNSGHRRTVLVISGHPYVGQRTAIDWVKIDENGMTFSGDPKKNENYFCYNQDVLAVADGTVVKVLDGVPENTPATGNSRAVTINLVNAGGNQVAIDLGGNRYALYAHLIPGKHSRERRRQSESWPGDRQTRQLGQFHWTASASSSVRPA